MKCIEEKLQNNILILDGNGTMIQQEDLTVEISRRGYRVV